MSLPEKLSNHPQEPQEKCGVTAVFSKTGKNLSTSIPLLQYELHHRGRDSSGMAVFHKDSGKMVVYTGSGSTGDVFQVSRDHQTKEKQVDFNFEAHNLLSENGIGHNRYGTSGDEHKDSDAGAQPMYAEWDGRKVAVAFNGNLPVAERKKLQKRLPDEMEPGTFDTEDIVRAIATAEGENWSERIVNGMKGVKGAYSLTILPDDGNVYGLRGPSGQWPLWLGQAHKYQEDDRVVIASESVTDSTLHWTEINSGELVKVSKDGIERQQVYEAEEARCVLHDVYGAHPESFMKERETYRSFRERIGEQLAKEHPIQADLYDGVPNSGRDAAVGYTQALGVPMTEIFKVLSSAERSYIAKNLDAAERIIKNKVMINEDLIKNNLLTGKVIALIEDSIIKGSTSKAITDQLLQAGAAEIHWVVATPQFDEDCDMGYVVKKELLIGVEKDRFGNYKRRTPKEVAQLIDATTVNYISSDGIRKVYGPEHSPCLACMGGSHPFHLNKENRQIKVFQSRIDKADEVVTINSAVAD